MEIGRGGSSSFSYYTILGVSSDSTSAENKESLLETCFAMASR
ncbi:hypothetical protein QN277_011832 [Acacia crassicarpa]|uniref:Uncharacterized protein n=1 Tax=Acacia crassicarpa TaxID=499986 RepID=A0AAE1TDY0_9FABA|nr:hypothetical protein QN277_011832 [Acacia crassicarpa]